MNRIDCSRKIQSIQSIESSFLPLKNFVAHFEPASYCHVLPSEDNSAWKMEFLDSDSGLVKLLGRVVAVLRSSQKIPKMNSKLGMNSILKLC